MATWYSFYFLLWEKGFNDEILRYYEVLFDEGDPDKQIKFNVFNYLSFYNNHNDDNDVAQV